MCSVALIALLAFIRQVRAEHVSAHWIHGPIGTMTTRAVRARLSQHADSETTALGKLGHPLAHARRSRRAAARSNFRAGGPDVPAPNSQLQPPGSRFLVPAFRPSLPVPRPRLSASRSRPSVLRLAAEQTPEAVSNKERWQSAFRALKNEGTLGDIAKEGFFSLGRGAVFAECDEPAEAMAGDEADAPQMNEVKTQVKVDQLAGKVNLKYLPLKTWVASDLGGIEEALIQQIEAYRPKESFIVVFQAFGITGGSKMQLTVDDDP